MSLLVIALFAAWGIVLLILVGLLAVQFLAVRQGVLVRPWTAADGDGPAGPRGWPSVCVVIPARNESREIGGCLESVLAQDYPNLSVLVVDDRSEDDTGEIVRGYARRDPRVRLESVSSLPPGWLGKSHALWLGTRGVTAEWILFLDADCRLDPTAVRSVVAQALRKGVELVSLWPRQAAGSFWEHMLIPLCAGTLALRFRPGRVNRAEGRDAFANGAFLLMRRDAYERIGGHREVRAALIEDIPLAELAKRRGVACWAGSGRDVFCVRMYDSFRAIASGWARIFVGAFRSGWQIALNIAWLLAGSLFPFVAAAVLAIDFALMPPGSRDPAAETLRWTATAFCAVHLLLAFAVTYVFWGFGRSPRRYLLLYPVSVVIVIAILVRAWWWLIVKRSIPWRDRRYPINRSGVITTPPETEPKPVAGACGVEAVRLSLAEASNQRAG